MSGDNRNQADQCPECQHEHTPNGCEGPPTSSDRWAGVWPSDCDCDFEATPMTEDPPEMSHEWGEGCVCGPTPGAVENDDGSVTFTLRHHGLDGRGWTEEDQ